MLEKKTKTKNDEIRRVSFGTLVFRFEEARCDVMRAHTDTFVDRQMIRQAKQSKKDHTIRKNEKDWRNGEEQ